MQLIELTIAGTSPIIINKFTDAAAQAATDGERASTKGERLTPAEDAEERLYVDEQGQPIMPGPNLLMAFTSAGRFFKNGKTQLSTTKSSIIPAAIGLSEVYFPLQSKAPWKVDTRPVRIPATGGRILRHRPMFDDWSIDFSLTVETDLLTVARVRDVVDAAGSRIGLCDFRPECRGPFGRFKVTSWKLV